MGVETDTMASDVAYPLAYEWEIGWHVVSPSGARVALGLGDDPREPDMGLLGIAWRRGGVWDGVWRVHPSREPLQIALVSSLVHGRAAALAREARALAAWGDADHAAEVLMRTRAAVDVARRQGHVPAPGAWAALLAELLAAETEIRSDYDVE